jgi:hypothetical protein
MGPAVWNGGFSTFLAFILLAVSSSYVFKSFFKVKLMRISWRLRWISNLYDIRSFSEHKNCSRWLDIQSVLLCVSSTFDDWHLSQPISIIVSWRWLWSSFVPGFLRGCCLWYVSWSVFSSRASIRHWSCSLRFSTSTRSFTSFPSWQPDHFGPGQPWVRKCSKPIIPLGKISSSDYQGNATRFWITIVLLRLSKYKYLKK